MAGENQPSLGKRKRIIITVAGGGFFWQSKCVAQGLGDGFEFHYVTPDNVTDHVDQGLPIGKFYHVSRITTHGDRALTRKILNSLASVGDAYRVIKKVKPEAVVCVASSIALPLCFWAKVLGMKTVFVESITRVNNPSLTGRILSALRLCDRFYVQWPECENLYSGAIFRGTVL